MALQHKLSNARVRIPELDTAVFGTTQNPITMGRESNAEDEVLAYLSVSVYFP